MSRGAVAIRDVGIRRMPGFDRGGDEFSVSGLSDGITIVHGPNGSGKTTLARAIQRLVWPELAREAGDAVLGTLAIDGATWRVEIDGDRVQVRHQGRPADLPVPSAEVRARYYVALHELVQADGRGFAATIEQETAGGYSMRAAREALGFEPVRPRSGQATRELDEARRHLREVQAEQAAVSRAAAELGERARDLAEAQAAAERAEALAALVAYRETAAVHDLAGQACDAFAPVHARFTGGEAAEVDRLSATVAGVDREIVRIDRDMVREQETLDAARVALDACPETMLDELRRRLVALERLDERVAALSDARATSASRRTRESDALGAARSSGAGAGVLTITSEQVARLEAVASRRAEVSVERAACRTVRDWLGVQAEEPLPDLARLDEAVSLLGEWLTAGGGAVASVAARWTGMAAGGLLIVLGILNALSVHPAWLAFVPAGVAAAVMAWRAGRGDRERAHVEARYRRRSTLPAIEKWEVEVVSGRLRDLLAEQADARLAASRHALWRDGYALRAQRVEEAWRRLEDERATCVTELGVDPARGDGELLWAVRAMQRLHEANAAVAERDAERAVRRRERAAVLAAIGACLRPYGYDGLDDAAACGAALDDLTRRRQAADAASSRLALLRRTREDQQRRRAAAADERSAVYTRCAVPDGDTHALQVLCDRHAEYEAAADRRATAARRMEDAEQRLRACAGFDEAMPALSRDDAVQARAAAESLAQRADGLNRDIARTQERLRHARESHDVAAAIAAWERAREQLADKRSADYAAAIGDMLAAHIESHHAAAARPRVFARARELLIDMTGGRYRLEMGASGETFHATDTIAGVERELDALSSGTRVQLLLAVRLAFVETCESGAMLPLIADEVLANSDDPRADAIIRAIVTIARTGRQVFYFTAQRDEVAKWVGALTNADVSYRVVDLARVRGLTVPPGPVPAHAADTVLPHVPAPEGRDHAAYGRLLGIPPIDPRRGAAGVHAWYLVCAPDLLHQLLEAGAARWGEVDTYTTLGGAEVAADEPELAVARVRAEAADVMCRTWAVGRGTPLDASALEASSLVTDAFRDRLHVALDASGGDAAAFMEQVAALPRFSKKKQEDLAQYLRDGGFLDERTPLSREEIAMRMMAAVARARRDGLVSRDDIARLLDGLAETDAGRG